MEKLSTTRASVAWFKLHEFVQRREKERALSIYKLLVHSISDRAVALQLMGDLLDMFDDNTAYAWYQQAAYQYEQAERYAQAIALYRYMLFCRPTCDEYYKGLVNLYSLSSISSMVPVIQDYLVVLIEQKRTLDAHEYIQRAPCSDEQRVLLHEFFISCLLDIHSGRDRITVHPHVAAAIESLAKVGANVDDFCDRLESLDPDVYLFAKDYALSVDCNSAPV